MEKHRINLTLPIVIDEIKNILATYPKSPYQEAFSATDLREELVAYVLNRVPNQYLVVDQIETLEKTRLSIPHSSQRLLDIENYIHLGIHEILGILNPIQPNIQPAYHQDVYQPIKAS